MMETKEDILKESDVFLLKKRLCKLEKENIRLKLILSNITNIVKNNDRI